MIKFIDSISTIHNNVFSLTPILLSFYTNLKKREKNILLAYLIFPIVFNQECLKELLEFNSNSRLTRITTNKKIMAGFQENFEYYKHITNNCLQYAIDCNFIEIDDDLSVKVKVANNETTNIIDPSLNNSMRLASRLHKIFTLDVLNIYIQFGIKYL
ncbi:three component ABC system middle component [Dysgonomonas sp. ZJ279]|uniref:three component ABC system middle component n=1 Tax=Dysgonomonas sp. ZJ279 TaxID=2709796 RepID=UPI0013ED567C|nr:three component ABC system middle component [Dysgonomonas sp. ZJ279]